jgi:hypothetical protein
MDKNLINKLISEGWYGLHDTIVDLADVQPTEEQAKEVLSKLPDYLLEDAAKWGLDDSDIRDRIYSYLENDSSLLDSVKTSG